MRTPPAASTRRQCPPAGPHRLRLGAAGLLLALSAAVPAPADDLPGQGCVASGGSSCPAALPDLAPAGVVSTMTVVACDVVVAARVGLRLQHPWAGDLVVTLEGPSGSRVLLLDRPGFPADPWGCDQAGVDAVLGDGAAAAAEETCADDQGGTVPALSGELRPGAPLAALAGQVGSGEWRLRVADFGGDDLGQLADWSLDLQCEGLDADLGLTKTASPADPDPGSSVVYTLSVTNLGPDPVSSAVVTDLLPAALAYLEDSCTGTAAEGAWTWRTGPVGVGQTVSCDLTAQVDVGFGGALVNTATVTSDHSDPEPGNDSAAAAVMVGLFADGFEDGTTSAWSETVGGGR